MSPFLPGIKKMEINDNNSESHIFHGDEAHQ